MQKNRRKFIKTSAVVASLPLIPHGLWSQMKNKKLRTVHIGVGGMGFSDLKDISSHNDVLVVGLCDVDNAALFKAGQLFPDAKKYKDYRLMLKELQNDYDAVVVSASDHTTHQPL